MINFIIRKLNTYSLFRYIFPYTPKIGELYSFDTGNPFKYYLDVKVLDVRRGWVKYEYQSRNGEEFNTISSTTVRTFATIYVKANEESI